MKKSFYLLALSIFILSACSNVTSIEESSSNPITSDNPIFSSESISSESVASSVELSSSSTPSSSIEELTPEELIVKEIINNIATVPLALTGTLRYVNSYIPDLNYPDNKVVQSDKLNGQYVVAFTDEYYYLKEADANGYESFLRYDHDVEGYTICKVLNPATNEREDSFVLNPLGQKIKFVDYFSNLFKEKDSYKAFELKGNQLVNKPLNESGKSPYFDFKEFYSRVTNSSTSFPLNRMIITLNDNNKPTNLNIQFWEIGTFTTKEYIYNGVFINESEAGVPPIPSVHEHKSEHEPLQEMFNNLHSNMNYTLNYNVDEGNQITSFKIYVNKDAYYIDYGDEKDNSLSKGAYVEKGKGLIDFVKTDTGHKAKGLPKTIRTVEEIFYPYWCYKAEMFSLQDDGYYLLSNEIGVYDNVSSIFIPDSLGFYCTYINDSSFKMKIDNGDLLYQYDVTNVHVSVTIDHINNTALPFAIGSIEPYIPATTFSEFIQKLNPMIQAEYWTRIGLLTNQNINILPYVDTPYSHSGKIDSFGSYETGQLTFTSNANLVFDFDTHEELVEVTDQYIELLSNNPDYEYDYDNDSFIYNHDGVNLEITFKHLENTAYAPYGLEYNIANLNEAPSLEW